MAQIDRAYPQMLYALHSRNENIIIYNGSETIVLEDVSTPTITNFAITAKNNSIAGNLTKISVYGSANGIDYFLFKNNLLQTSLLPGTIQHLEFIIVTLFIRITVVSNADINVDLHLHGSLT